MSKMGRFERLDLTGTSVDPALRPKAVRDTQCTSPLLHHTASPEAMATDILQTRCIGCRRRIYRTDAATDNWKVQDSEGGSRRGR